MDRTPEMFSTPMRRGGVALLALSALAFGISAEKASTAEADPIIAASASEPVFAEIEQTVIEDCAISLDVLNICLKTRAEEAAEIEAAQLAAERAHQEQIKAEADLANFYAQVAAEEQARQALAEQEAARKAAEQEAAIARQALVATYPTGCENYRSLVAQYEWPVEQAMLTMSEESQCNPNAISATDDHGLFQLHNRPVYDPAENVRIAYALWEDGRVGQRNFSAWYAVCTPGNNPQPKFEGVDCQ